MESYHNMVNEVTERAEQMRVACVEPVIDDRTGGFITESTERNERLEKVLGSTVFDTIGQGGGMVLASASNSIRNYVNQRGYLPGDDLLAAAHQAIENVVALTTGTSKPAGNTVFEAAVNLNTQDTAQAMMRNRMIALILPVILQSVTSNIVGFIPGQYNQSEVFKVWRTAGSTFGDLTAGDRIQWDFEGQYGAMDQRHLTIAGNGVKTGSAAEFDFVSTTTFGSAYPMKKKSIKIIHDGNNVAKDDGAGALHGTFMVGATAVTVTGTVNYVTGVIHPVFSTAPANGVKIHVGFDVDIERAPQLIPTINHEMDSAVLYPHEAAIAGSTTLQGLWAMRREFNLNIDNMNVLAMKNLLAADKDRKHLKDLYFYMKNSESWTYTIPATGVNMQDYYETLRTTLIKISTALLKANGVSGLVGIVADSSTCAIMKSMRSPHFDPAPGYVQIPQPHYVGRLFGMWDLYEDPQRTAYSSLCFAKGRNICEAAYIAGDAIPALTFKHPMLGDLKSNSTLWELAYRDLQPFNGRDYIMELKLVAA